MAAADDSAGGGKTAAMGSEESLEGQEFWKLFMLCLKGPDCGSSNAPTQGNKEV